MPTRARGGFTSRRSIESSRAASGESMAGSEDGYHTADHHLEGEQRYDDDGHLVPISGQEEGSGGRDVVVPSGHLVPSSGQEGEGSGGRNVVIPRGTSLAESSGIGGRLVQDQEEGSGGLYLFSVPNGHDVLDGLTGKATPYVPPPSWIPWIEGPWFGWWTFGSDAVAGGGDMGFIVPGSPDMVDPTCDQDIVFSPAGKLAQEELHSNRLNLGSAGNGIISTASTSSSRCGLLDVLPEDMITEILLRLSPDDPVLFARLQMVCKRWHELLGDPCFIRLYRQVHYPPPMLGYFINEDEPGMPMEIARFVNMTTKFRPIPEIYDLASVVDSRHGLVLFYVRICSEEEERFVVWDPLMVEEEDQLWIDGFPFPDEPQHWTAAVMCGLLECDDDHLHCHGGPFLVVAARTRRIDSFTALKMYSSYDDGWSDEILHKEQDQIDTKAGVLVGRKLFLPTVQGVRILEYDIDEEKLVVLDSPPPRRNTCGYAPHTALLVAAEGGGLGFASADDCMVYVWVRETAGAGAMAWTLRTSFRLFSPPRLVGFAHHGGDIFLHMARVGRMFCLRPSSRKMLEMFRARGFRTNALNNIKSVVPYHSFFCAFDDNGWHC